MRRPGPVTHSTPIGLIGACLTQAHHCLVRRPAWCGVTPTQSNEGMTVTNLARDWWGRYAPRRPRSCWSGRTRSSPRRRELRHDGERLQETLEWLSDFGLIELVGVEGTGSYGARFTRHLKAERIRVVEVDRPNRQRRRRRKGCVRSTMDNLYRRCYIDTWLIDTSSIFRSLNSSSNTCTWS